MFLAHCPMFGSSTICNNPSPPLADNVIHLLDEGIRVQLIDTLFTDIHNIVNFLSVPMQLSNG